MATLVLSAAGSAIGGAAGGTLLGVSAATIGQAAGALAGTAIDQLVLGPGAQAVSQPPLERLHLQDAKEGAPIPRVWGRTRLSGQVIWAPRFKSQTQTSGGGKGGGGAQSKTYTYSLSLAVAICEGPIERLGRVWENNKPFSLSDVAHRIYKGDEDQAPDALIEAIEGAQNAPAYRGVAYIVFEDLPLRQFGDRTPQFSFEVFRRPPSTQEQGDSLKALAQGVAISPGSGEFTLATQPIRREIREGVYEAENIHDASGEPDFIRSLDQLQDELPDVKTVSLIVSWFGTDLRCGRCEIHPGSEHPDRETRPISWRVGGVGRAGARQVSMDAQGRPHFGGTPADATVIEAIKELKSRGYKILLYPFILMDVPPGNNLPNPWTGDPSQPVFPWRGRITLEGAPGTAASNDKTPAAAQEVADFFGAAQASDFQTANGLPSYSGPDEWRYRRFILHCAQLAKIAGGVDAFAIGSEMRSLTQIRSGSTSYPAVSQLQALAGEVRTLLGANTKLTYAADWSEYFGHHPTDGSGDAHFHLDPLWADQNIDAIGVDAYFPLADWRDESAEAPSVYDLEYLRSNVEGGEGYDWFYASSNDRRARTRTPITDGAYQEPWIYRPKDIRNWWLFAHHNRTGGVRDAQPTAWVPQSKPVWLTELGCPAVDRGANQPNVFYDPKSSESALPYFSRGVSDPYMQQRYLEALLGYWRGELNPISAVYGAPMIDLGGSCVWTWDARPWPDFPVRENIWADGANHALGHWLTGRIDTAPLADVVADICRAAGLSDIDVSGLTGVVEGYRIKRVATGRELLQPLMTAYGFDAVESGGVLKFTPRGAPARISLNEDDMVVRETSDDPPPPLNLTRQDAAALPSSVRFGYVDTALDYQSGAVEALAEEAEHISAQNSEAPISMTQPAAQAVADRWLSEAWTSRDTAEFSLPPSRLALEPTDVVEIETDGRKQSHRLARMTHQEAIEVESSRTDAGLHRAAPTPQLARIPAASASIAAPAIIEMLDLPLLSGEENPYAPHIAGFVSPWPGALAAYHSLSQDGFSFGGEIEEPAILGRLTQDLPRAQPHLWTRGAQLHVSLSSGVLASVEPLEVLGGANAAALQTPQGEWEVVQFQQAELIGLNEYALTGLLRGQAGTEPFIPDVLPIGARFVLLNSALTQPSLTQATLGAPLYYRVGPANLGYDAPSYTALNYRHAAAALRPYAPAHLRARAEEGGGLRLNWVRRTRLGGDSWDGYEAPLSEDAELYQLRIVQNGVAHASLTTSTSEHFLSAAETPSGAYEVSVAQISSLFGPGPEARISIS